MKKVCAHLSKKSVLHFRRNIMKNIIKGLLQTPALLLGILWLMFSIATTLLAMKYNFEKDFISLETLGMIYTTMIFLFLAPACGVGMKREFERFFIRGDK